MKNVVAAFVAAMPLTSGNFLKPLNPLLGETLQMEYADGSRLFMEQTCHHPPVAGFYLEGPGKEYTAYGFLKFSVGFGYNKMLVTPQGERSVHFADGTTITCDCPSDRILNLFWGQMCHETLGVQIFTDAKNGIRCRLDFGNPSGRSGVPSDYFEGVIEKFDPSSPHAATQELVSVEGSWVGFIDFAGVRYWDIRSTQKMSMCTPAQTLNQTRGYAQIERRSRRRTSSWRRTRRCALKSSNVTKGASARQCMGSTRGESERALGRWVDGLTEAREVLGV
jgi:hypothetical protein